MRNKLEIIYSPEEIQAMTRSWLAFSATNIVFREDDNGTIQLLLGDRAKPAMSIPEDGRWCLIGGFNTFDGLTMWADVADAHLAAQLGITVEPHQCSGFLPCEYDMAKITAPLNTPFGQLPIKRVAFDRIVLLTPAQAAALKPQGKLGDVRWVTLAEFQTLAELKGPEGLSFPHQVAHVETAFDLLDSCFLPLNQLTPRWEWDL